ncbi:GSCOCG00012812001-RA-CDS, partial [Cotesia congregata]
ETTPESQAEQVSAKDSASKILGMDQTCTYKEAKYMSELNNTWSKWMIEGLPEKNKKDILESYNTKGDFYTESPKLNLELGPLLTDIAKKRDQHFADTQSCVGTALSALGAAVSLLLEPPEEGLDEDLFTDYISHAGQILSDVYYQQSVARKSYITPQLNKNIKPLVETMISKEWLYGDNLKDKVKDMKEIEKACADIKDKPAKVTTKTRDQGNGKYPPASNRQVGYQQKRRVIKFRPKSYPSTQRPSKPVSRTTSQSSSRK